MILRASRNFVQPKQFSQWKVGENKPYFISFVHNSEQRVVGRSLLFKLHMIEPKLTDIKVKSYFDLSPTMMGLIIMVCAVLICMLSIFICCYIICESIKGKKELAK